MAVYPGFPDGFDPGWWREEITTPPVWTQAATTANNSATVTVTSFSYPPIVGQQVSGTGIPANTTVSATGVLSLTLSQPATADGPSTLTIGAEPITVDQLKTWARIEYSDLDTSLLPNLITDARLVAEGPELKRAIMLQARTLYLMGFPWGGGYFNRFIRSQGPSPWWLPSSQGLIRMAYPPFQGLISIQYIDQASGLLDTIPLSMVAQSNTPATPGTIMPQYGQVWPIPRPIIDAVQINWMCGYGAFQSQIPMTIQNALCGMCASTYVNRHEYVATGKMTLNPAIERSLQAERWGTYN